MPTAALREIPDFVPGWPIVYWWDAAFLERYKRADKLGTRFPAKKGLITSNNARFVRKPWEVLLANIQVTQGEDSWHNKVAWAPLISGAAGLQWYEPLREVLCWRNNGLEVKELNGWKYGSYSRQIFGLVS